MSGIQLPDGLKESLAIHGFTRKRILKSDVSVIATILGIDEYVAKLIIDAVKKEQTKK
jgi:hypothetical protein